MKVNWQDVKTFLEEKFEGTSFNAHEAGDEFVIYWKAGIWLKRITHQFIFPAIELKKTRGNNGRKVN